MLLIHTYVIVEIVPPKKKTHKIVFMIGCQGYICTMRIGMCELISLVVETTTELSNLGLLLIVMLLVPSKPL